MPIEQWTTGRTNYVDLCPIMTIYDQLCESHCISGRLIISIIVAVSRISNIKSVAKIFLLESNSIFSTQDFIWLQSIIQIDTV